MVSGNHNYIFVLVFVGGGDLQPPPFLLFLFYV